MATVSPVASAPSEHDAEPSSCAIMGKATPIAKPSLKPNDSEPSMLTIEFDTNVNKNLRHTMPRDAAERFMDWLTNISFVRNIRVYDEHGNRMLA